MTREGSGGASAKGNFTRLKKKKDDDDTTMAGRASARLEVGEHIDELGRHYAYERRVRCQTRVANIFP